MSTNESIKETFTRTGHRLVSGHTHCGYAYCEDCGWVENTPEFAETCTHKRNIIFGQPARVVRQKLELWPRLIDKLKELYDEDLASSQFTELLADAEALGKADRQMEEFNDNGTPGGDVGGSATINFR